MRTLLLGVALSLALAGCGKAAGPETKSAPTTASGAATPDAREPQAGDVEIAADAGQPPAPKKPGDPVPAQPAAKPEAPAKPAATAMPRQIIYVATVNLVVKEMEEARVKIIALMTRVDGFIADSEIGSRQGTTRVGRWVVRLPASRYQEFVDGLSDVGIPENVQQKAQDVTQEFIDLTARMVNQRRLEDRLAKLLEDRGGGLKEAIEVERELARVRAEIETMEGRLRYLKNQVALSTVTVVLREEQNYVPPQAPSFGGRITSAWHDSLQALQSFVQGLAILIVALIPWLLPAALVAAPLVWLWKRRRAGRELSSAGIEIVPEPRKK